MNKKSSGAIIYILLFLITACLVCGIIGYMENKMVPEENEIETDDVEYKITYRYYLDGIEVKEAIEQEEIEIANESFEGAIEKKDLYSFDKYLCTNNVKGSWDEEKWEFVPKLTSNTSCKLYFVKNFHDVTITAINATLPNSQKEIVKSIEKDKETIVNIVPNPGYKYTNVECTNNAKAEFNNETNNLVIKEASKDAICTVTFGIDNYKAEVIVQNGSTTENTKNANYGENITFNVTPSESYGNPTITCTNDQKASYANGILTITALSKETICTINFTIVKNYVSLTVENGTILSVTPSPQEAKNGKAAFGISANQGYQLTGASYECNNGAKIILQSSTVTVEDITADTTCKVTLKETGAE